MQKAENDRAFSDFKLLFLKTHALIECSYGQFPIAEVWSVLIFFSGFLPQENLPLKW